jgi:hypothetical protein
MPKVEIDLTKGGDLVTRRSTDQAGAYNYVVKRDIRRDEAAEVRREGDRLFAPKSGGTGMQPYPNDPAVNEAVTLHFTARRDDGKTAYICATPTRLFRYFAFEDIEIYASGVYEAGVFGQISNGVWLVIGSGFSSNAHPWEAMNVAGYAVFNNGVDLPVSYHISELSVEPIHELREQGIAFVGTIEEIAGIAVFSDIAVIHDDYLKTAIESVGYGAFSDADHYDRVHYRIIWGDPVGPRRWGSSVPGSMAANSRILTVDYPISSIKDGDEVRVVGAGASGGDLLTTLLFKSTSTTWILADKASTAVEDEPVSKTDAATLSVGRFDTLDVSSPILRTKKFQDRLVVAKSTGFVLGEYTGNPQLPFVFTTIYSKDQEQEMNCLAWRWTLVDVAGDYLLYAGGNDFYRFDLVTRRPQLHPSLSLCSNIFFDAVSSQADDSAVFAINNGFTKELWFMFPSSGADKGLVFDYRTSKCSTLGEAYSSGGMIDKPAATISHGAAELWFVLGLSNGTIVQYGFDRTGPFIWTRRGVNVTNLMYAGTADFGDPWSEKHISQYLLLLASQSPDTAVTVSFFGVRNPGEALEELPDSPEVFASPLTKNTSYLHYLVHLIQERISITGSANVMITQRVWMVSRAGGSSFVRR